MDDHGELGATSGVREEDPSPLSLWASTGRRGHCAGQPAAVLHVGEDPGHPADEQHCAAVAQHLGAECRARIRTWRACSLAGTPPQRARTIRGRSSPAATSGSSCRSRPHCSLGSEGARSAAAVAPVRASGQHRGAGSTICVTFAVDRLEVLSPYLLVAMCGDGCNTTPHGANLLR